MLSALTSEVIQSAILLILDRDGHITDSRNLQLPTSPAVLVGESPEEQEILKGALNSLCVREMVEIDQKSVDSWHLTEEGQAVLDSGSAEYRLWEALGEDGALVSVLESRFGKDVYKIANGNALKQRPAWVSRPEGGKQTRNPAVGTPRDATREGLLQISNNAASVDAKVLKEYAKRRLASPRKLPFYSVRKGIKFAKELPKLDTDLTQDMLASGSWEQANFKEYNFAAQGTPTNGGALHPLLKVRSEFREIFFEMGFSEMPTNRFVESGFWNFDALYVPQQHPARELQDTFYISDPPSTMSFPRDYMERVRNVHQGTGETYGSLGYRYEWKEAEASKLVLRTHTTAVSAAMLYEAAQAADGFKPCKLFSIDRVFRNEAVDATHLAEFHQVEGVVADYNITLGDLIGFMQIFFSKMGLSKLRFKPAYNPYTEPSLEIFSYHPGLRRWIEIGNSGMFRPEMLEPMGLPKDVRALGWGLSLERPTMIRYGIRNIRDLLGHRIPLDLIVQSSAVRFGK